MRRVGLPTFALPTAHRRIGGRGFPHSMAVLSPVRVRGWREMIGRISAELGSKIRRYVARNYPMLWQRRFEYYGYELAW